MFSLIDTHCHLDQLEDINSALEKAKQEGVEAVVAVGTNYQSNVKNLDIANSNPLVKIFVAMGIHPTEIKAGEVEKTLEFIRQNIQKAIAIGEIGLDYWRKEIKKGPGAKEEQRQVFISQLKIAQEFNLPAVIHSRGAWKECLELCLSSKVKKAVFHWYSGPLDILREIIREGFLISATPALGCSQQHQEAIRTVPVENILIETDSPVFYQNTEGGFKAGPKDVIRTLSLLAQIKNQPEEQIKSITAKNAVEFFNLKKYAKDIF